MPEQEKEHKKQESQENLSESLPLKDEDIFDGKAPESDSFEPFAGSAPAAQEQQSAKSQPSQISDDNIAIAKNLRFMQYALAACIVLMATVVGYILFSSKSRQADVERIVPLAQNLQEISATGAEQADSALGLDEENIEEIETHPVSIRTAKSYYLQDEYKKALYVYKKLRSNLVVSDTSSTKDYLLLCSAICNLKLANTEQAVEQLKTVSSSEFNFVRLCAVYYLCQIDLEKKQFDSARSKAYQALAIIELVAADKKLASIGSDCKYFAASASTRSLTELSADNADFPADIFNSRTNIYDPIADAAPEILQESLSSQKVKFQAGVLFPAIEKHQLPQTQQQTVQSGPRCSVVAYDCSVEELLSCFAAKFSLELIWEVTGDIQAVRQKPVRLYMSQVRPDEFITTALGCAGLAAEKTDSVVRIYKPSEYTVLSEHIDRLFSQACRLWQEFVLVHFQDDRVCNAHFALANLYTVRKDIPQAIDEYKLVASKYSQNRLAPFSLLQSAKLKLSLKDFVGGRSDLRDLVEQYPDCRITDRAYGLLAEITAVQGDKMQAGKLFTKVYNLNYSPDSQRQSAFKAAEAFYQAGDFESAIKWATTYIDSARVEDKESLCKIYLLVGKIYLGWNQYDKACAALRAALGDSLSKQQYCDTIFALIDGYCKANNSIDALDVLESVDSWQFTENQFMQLLIIKSGIYRDMGLYNKAVATLSDRAEYISDKQLKLQMLYEIAISKICLGDLNSAYKNLAQIVADSDLGQLNDKASLKLAEVCIQINRGQQAQLICSRLLKNSTDEQTRQAARQLNAKVYGQQNDFDRAALSLLDSAGAEN